MFVEFFVKSENKHQFKVQFFFHYLYNSFPHRERYCPSLPKACITGSPFNVSEIELKIGALVAASIRFKSLIATLERIFFT